MIPPAVREIPQAEMQQLYNSVAPESRMRQIIRRPDGQWRSGDSAQRTYTTNRNEAYIYPNHGATPGDHEEDSIFEILPPEGEVENAAAGTVIPPAVQEIVRSGLYEFYCAHHQERPLPDLLRRKLIVRMADGRWRTSRNNWREEQLTEERNEACIFECFGSTNGAIDDGSVIELLPFEGEDYKPAEVQKPKKVSLMFPPDFVCLMEAAPKNEMVRGWILKVTKQLPPEDIDSVDKLEAWLQTLPAPKTPVAALSGNGFSIPVGVTQIETGRIAYSVTQAATVPFRFTDDELRLMVRDEVDGGGDMESLAEVLSDKIGNDIWDHDINWADNGDMEYGDRNSIDSDDPNYEYNADRLQETMEQWIRSNMPDAVELLGI